MPAPSPHPSRRSPEEERLARERALRAEAEAAVHARDEILAIVSHDLRNPLQTISMSAAVLETLAGEKGASAAAVIKRAVARMNSLIQDLLDVNRIATGRFEVAPAVIEAATICDEAATLFTPLCEAKQQRFACHVEGDFRVRADHDRLVQALSNLVGNAVKFTPEGGLITLRVRKRDGEALFEVADTGPGIAAEDLPHIFDRFWQARRVRRGGSVGLGLAIVQGIVRAHGGRIWAESEPGVGARFFFTVPLADGGERA